MKKYSAMLIVAMSLHAGVVKHAAGDAKAVGKHAGSDAKAAAVGAVHGRVNVGSIAKRVGKDVKDAAKGLFHIAI